MKYILYLAILMPTFCFTQTHFLQKKGQMLLNPPYYFQYGYSQRSDDFQIYLPYVGLGMQPTKFSISYFANTGIAIFYKKFTWKLEYWHGIIPDLSLFDYKNIEFYGQNYFSYDFSGVRFSSLTRFGKMLYAYAEPRREELDNRTKIMPGLKQIFSLDSQLFNNEFIIFSSMINLGIDYIIPVEQISFFIKTAAPITFDFLHSKLGFAVSLFYVRSLSTVSPFIIGENYTGYDSAVNLVITDNRGLYQNFYCFTGALDMIYRIYFRSLPSPANDLYVAIGGNMGFGKELQNSRTDFLYMGNIALGYELYGSVPFEIRFSLDQDKNFFINMSVVSPIAHRFDRNLD